MIQIRSATSADAAAVAAIYNQYVRESVVTFEETEVEVPVMAGRIEDTLAAQLPWMVAELDGQTVGYAYAAPWRTRSAYRHSVETSVYLKPGVTRRGLGTLLYRDVLAQLCSQGMHIAIGGITLPNPASVALHERLGFQQVAHFREVGFKFGRWLDVGYWQLEL